MKTTLMVSFTSEEAMFAWFRDLKEMKVLPDADSLTLQRFHPEPATEILHRHGNDGSIYGLVSKTDGRVSLNLKEKK